MSQVVLNYDIPTRLPRPQRLTILLLVVLTLTLLTFLGMAISGSSWAHMWSLFAAGRGFSPAELVLNRISTEVGYFTFPSSIATLVSLLLWMMNAQKKLRVLTPERLRFSRIDVVTGWVLPWWFVIRPFEVMKEIYARNLGRQRRDFTPLCGCWWGFWLLANLVALTRALALSLTDLEGADLQIAYGIYTLIAAIPYLISGACLAVLVYKTDRAQARLTSRNKGVGSHFR